MRTLRLPAMLLAAMTALVVLATGNLSGIGIGDISLMYDAVALPRLAVAVVLVLAAWAAWFFFARDEDTLRVDPVWAILGALAVWAVISMAVSPHRALAILGQSERLEGAVTIVLYAATYGIALQALRRSEDVRLVASCIAGSAVGLSVLGIAQYAGVDPTNYSFEAYGFDMRRAFATLGNPNFLAGLLVLALPLIVALALSARGRAERVVWSAGALLAGIALFATFTRGAWLAFGVEALLGAVLWIRAPRGPLSRRIQAGLAVAAVALLVLVVISLNAPPDINVASRISDAFQATGSVSERSLLVGIAGSAALARPIFGYGPDTFLPALRLHRSDAYVDAFHTYGIVNNAHSWPLQFAATIGFIGAALLVAAILVSLWKSRKRLFSPNDGAGSMVLAGMWVGCLGFALHMALSVGVLAATVPFWILLGALGAGRASERSLTHRHRTIAGVLAALLCVGSLVAAVAFVSADATYLQARLAFAAGDNRSSFELARRARAYNPISLKYARGTAEASGRLVTEAIQQRAEAAEVRNLYAAALAEYRHVFRLDPNDYPARAWLAALQARTGMYLSDEELLTDALATVRIAVKLDRDYIEVTPLLSSINEQSIKAASEVQRLP